MGKFKVGDRIIVTGTIPNRLVFHQIGGMGTITRVSEDQTYEITFDDNTRGDGYSDNDPIEKADE